MAAGVVHLDLDERLLDLRSVVQRKPRQRHGAEDHHADQEHQCRHRAVHRVAGRLARRGPRIFHKDLFDDLGTDGVLEPGMALCVESYIGEEDGHEGVKLEQQVLITEEGVELLSTFPFEEELLGREV